MTTPVNSPEERIITNLSLIRTSLSGIATSLSYAFGPMKREEIIDPSEEFAKQNKEEKRERLLVYQVELLRNQNIIAVWSARIAVVGVVVTAIFSVLNFFYK